MQVRRRRFSNLAANSVYVNTAWSPADDARLSQNQARGWEAEPTHEATRSGSWQPRAMLAPDPWQL